MLSKRAVFPLLLLVLTSRVIAAEWKAEPSLYVQGIYNDNVGMRETNEQSSSGFTVGPRLKLSGNEYQWNMAMDARLRFTRYNDIEDSDSDNYFFDLGGSYKTERHTFTLDSYLERNNAYDTDYETQLPNAGLVDDHTERETKSVSPSWLWKSSETSSLTIGLSITDVEFDEVTSLNYRDYQYNGAYLKSIWGTGMRSQIGLTLSLSQYENEIRESVFLGVPLDDQLKYDYTVYQLDYIYNVGETSSLNVSLGTRNIDGVRYDQITGCVFEIFPGVCAIPEVSDVPVDEDGLVIDVSYTYSEELSSFAISGSRNVTPSSYGGAQEQRLIALTYKRNITERFNTQLILDARRTESVQGFEVGDDRERYRIEPSINWKLTRDWNLGFLYRYIKQDQTDANIESESNAIYVNLSMSWPRMASTY